ncbi:MAG: hypothetical protein FVQ77_06595 [Cytophagales bacterium]|nr:hypothetical protein [Cytophagales bacterium]
MNKLSIFFLGTWNLEFGTWDLEFGTSSFGFRISDFGFGIWDLGLRDFYFLLFTWNLGLGT